MKFKGWDWTELLDVWPESRKVTWPESTAENPFEDEQAKATWIRERLNELHASVGEVESKSKARLNAKDRRRILNVRAFVACVGSGAPHQFPHFDAPIFKAVAEVPDDGTFLFYTDMMLECMWT